MIRAQGVNTDNMIVLGLLISNGFVGMSGALIGQFQGFADVGMGIGTIVIGLASVIIGEVVFGTKSFVRSLIAVVLGSIVYRIVIAAVLYMGMPPKRLEIIHCYSCCHRAFLAYIESKMVGSLRRTLC